PMPLVLPPDVLVLAPLVLPPSAPEEAEASSASSPPVSLSSSSSASLLLEPSSEGVGDWMMQPGAAKQSRRSPKSKPETRRASRRKRVMAKEYRTGARADQVACGDGSACAAEAAQVTECALEGRGATCQGVCTTRSVRRGEAHAGCQRTAPSRRLRLAEPSPVLRATGACRRRRPCLRQPHACRSAPRTSIGAKGLAMQSSRRKTEGGRMHLVFLASLVPHATPTSGYELANAAIIDALRREGVRVTVLGYAWPDRVAEVAADAIVLGAVDVRTAMASTPQKVRWLARAVGSGMTFASAKVRIASPTRVRTALADLGPYDGYVVNSV